jgi:hypothetical protein
MGQVTGVEAIVRVDVKIRGRCKLNLLHRTRRFVPSDPKCTYRRPATLTNSRVPVGPHFRPNGRMLCQRQADVFRRITSALALTIRRQLLGKDCITRSCQYGKVGILDALSTQA